MFASYFQGQTYLAAGDGASAAAAFRRILEQRGLVGSCLTGALAQLGLARALALADERAASQQAYQAFLALWKTADSDLRLLAEARREVEALASD
jgi:hypothetical protein